MTWSGASNWMKWPAPTTRELYQFGPRVARAAGSTNGWHDWMINEGTVHARAVSALSNDVTVAAIDKNTCAGTCAICFAICRATT